MVVRALQEVESWCFEGRNPAFLMVFAPYRCFFRWICMKKPSFSVYVKNAQNTSVYRGFACFYPKIQSVKTTKPNEWLEFAKFRKISLFQFTNI